MYYEHAAKGREPKKQNRVEIGAATIMSMSSFIILKISRSQAIQISEGLLCRKEFTSGKAHGMATRQCN